MACLTRDTCSARTRGGESRGLGLHRADGGTPPTHRPMAATGGCRRRAWRGNRPDLLSPEVRLDGLGARRPLATPGYGGRPRCRRDGCDGAPDRDSAHGAPQSGWRGGRGSRRRSRGRRVPTHDRARRDGGRCPRPAVAQPRRRDERDPRRRSDRRGRVPADLSRSQGDRRLLSLGARARARRARL